MKDKTFFLVAFLLCMPLLSSAQSRIVYRYDGSGNRILRTAAPVSNSVKITKD